MPRPHQIRLVAFAAVAGALGTVLSLPTSAADRVSTVPSGRTLLLAGHGWGHGHGMSQDGANGAATKGLTADQIVSFYYPNTAKAANGNPSMRIKLSGFPGGYADVGRPTGSGAALEIHDLGSTGYRGALPTDATKWRFTAGSSGITLAKATGTGWQPYSPGGHASLPGPLTVGYNSSATADAPIRLFDSGGTEHDYRGYLRLIRNGTNNLTTLSIETMEDYLLGVVPRESPSSWPAAALQAQAIAARSYAQYNRDHAGSRDYDICDTTSCQVFKGTRTIAPNGTVTTLEAASTSSAVRATAGNIRTYGGKAIFAQYSASNGGWSTDGGTPYLIAQPDPYDGVTGSSSHSWRATLPASALESRYPSIGTLRRVRVTSRDGHGEWGGRVLQAVLEGSKGSVTVSGSDIYNAYSWPGNSTGLRHYWFQILPSPPADFDGSMTTDRSVWRPSTGRWYFQGHGSTEWGVSGDIPTPGDFNGDGAADVAVFRPSNGRWYFQGRGSTQWGTGGDVPVPGDYNGDGVTDVAVFRPSTGRWYVQGAAGSVQWGVRGDIPVAADYDGNGVTEMAVWRPSTGRWYVRGQASTQWGQAGDVPTPGDYNGNSTTDLAVWRPSTGRWYVRGRASVQWGVNGDVPVPGDYNRDGVTDLVVWRPSNGGWYQRGAGTVAYGVAGDVPLPLPSAIFLARWPGR